MRTFGESVGKRPKMKGRKLLVIGWDGVPFSMVSRFISEGRLNTLGKLASSGSLCRMDSIIPTVSGAAWASFMTGMDPSGHGIFGFIDRKPNSYDIYIPNASNLKAKTIPRLLSDAGKKSVVMNVPLTYPPEEINGTVISGFLAPNLERGTWPKSEAEILKGMGYVIDVDSWEAREDKGAFLRSLDNALKKRLEAALYYIENREWDFFMVHFMETDRLNHFYWLDFVQNHPEYAQAFLGFYQKLDNALKDLIDAASRSRDIDVMVLSDHGFTGIKSEVNLNACLKKHGYLKFTESEPEDLSQIDSSSKAYSLIPGRIYLNLKGREPGGSVEPGASEQKLLEEIAQCLKEMTFPETGERVIEKVFMRDEIYKGAYAALAPDLVAIPVDGFDLKAQIASEEIFSTGPIQGMHTFNDAFIASNNLEFEGNENLNITNVMPTILELMDVPVQENLHGKAFL